MNQNFPASELRGGSSFHHGELRGAALLYLGDLGYLGDGDPGHESSLGNSCRQFDPHPWLCQSF